MKDPVVLITGALTGIGRGTALAFASEGGRIVASGRRDAEGQELVAELRELGAEAELAPMCATRTTSRWPSLDERRVKL